MVRQYHVTVYPIDQQSETSVWWITLPGLLSYIHKIEYHTGETVFFDIHGKVDGIIAEDVLFDL